jgi:hypothetical protein
MQIIHLFILPIYLFLQGKIAFNQLKDAVCHVSALLSFLAAALSMGANHPDDLFVESVDEVEVLGEHEFAVGRLGRLPALELMPNKGTVLAELSDISHVLCLFKGHTLGHCCPDPHLLRRAIGSIFEDAASPGSVLVLPVHPSFITKCNKYYFVNHITISYIM